MSINYSHPDHLDLSDSIDSINLDTVLNSSITTYSAYDSTMNSVNITSAGTGNLSTMNSSWIAGTGNLTVSNSPWIGLSANIAPSNSLHVSGDANFEGNITVKGTDLTALLDRVQLSLEKMEERLNILTIDSSLEERWENLRQIGEQYRELEAQILDAERTWKILKT